MSNRQKDLFFLKFLQYSSNKFPKLSYFFLFFWTAQLFFIFIKLEVTPFFLYGVYSEKIPYSQHHKRTTVYVNGKDLASLNVSMREREVLMTGLENYLLMRANGGTDFIKTRVESRYAFLTNSPFYPSIKDLIYNHPEDVARFENWFRQKCSPF